MKISIFAGILLGLSIIFDGYMENIFIIATTIVIYTYFTYYEIKYKKFFGGLLLSFVIINIAINTIIKDDIDLKNIEIGEQQDETVVMLLYDGEDRNYNFRERANEIYFEKGYKSYLTNTYDLLKYKSYYEKLGSSEFKDVTYDISVELRDKLGGNYKVVNTYMYTKPYFENVLQEILSIGYRNIIICPMFITEGKDYEVFKDRLNEMKLSKYGINVKLTDVFYKSNSLAKLYKNEIVESVSENTSAGVLLIGLEDENNLEQDIIFREKIKYYIEKEKNNEIQIKMPLLENNKDDIIKSGEELLEFGIDIWHVIIPTCTIDNMHNKNLVESILNELDASQVRFHYIDPKDKVKILAEEVYTQITLMEK